jgi:hypothetical protein
VQVADLEAKHEESAPVDTAAAVAADIPAQPEPAAAS